MSNKLFVLPNKEFNVGSLDQALNHVFDSQPENKLKNLVIFVHGRGAGKIKHPQKAITQQLPFIENEYGTRAILFNWEGSGNGGGSGFPEKEARAASGDLYKVLSQLDKYRRQNAERLSGVKFSLLTHSMGSIVVEETIKRNLENIKEGLLDVLLLSSSASKSKKHSRWLNKASLAKNVLVTLNSEDGILGFGGFLRGRRLGKGLKKREISERASYVDLSNTGVNHRYFIAHTKSGTKKGQNNNPCIKAFYHAALNGSPVDLRSFPGTKKIKNDRVFVIKAKNGSRCD